MSSPSHHDQVPTKGSRLAIEALVHLANKIENIKGLNQNQMITKDLTENAESLRKIAIDVAELIKNRSGIDIFEYIESNKKIVLFALDVYTNDLRRSKEAILERVREIKGSDSNDEADKGFFLNDFFKMNNLDQLLANIEEFKKNLLSLPS